MKDFITPYGHVNFLAKRLFGSIGEIVDGSVAHMLPHGGGPIETHTHTHSHLFIVVKGEARIETPDGDVTIGENESYFVDGSVPHSVWNNLGTETVMIGMSVMPRQSAKEEI